MSNRLYDDYLQDERFNLITDPCGVSHILTQLTKANKAAFRAANHYRNLSDTTAALVDVRDGEYYEIWITGSSRPYDIAEGAAAYIRVR